MRVGFAAHNGRTYASVGRELIERGALESGQASWPKIRAWLKAHPKQAPEVLAVNPRYIFFRELEGDGPLGALGVALTPGRSMAVDPRFMPLGAPVFVTTTWPEDEEPPMRRLFVAQDVGGAIRGAVRGDLFFGAGAEAEKLAGSMKYPGRYWLLLPFDAARRHGWAG
jgi:membrane-bound lytic murein transglycosylase A